MVIKLIGVLFHEKKDFDLMFNHTNLEVSHDEGVMNVVKPREVNPMKKMEYEIILCTQCKVIMG